MQGVIVNPNYQPGSGELSIYYDPMVLVEMEGQLFKPASDEEAINFPKILELFVEPVSEEKLYER